MAPVRNGRLIFNEIPEGYPEPGKTTVYDDKQTIDLDNVPLNGSILVKTLVLSADPYMRSKMRDPKVKSYQPAYTLGEPIHGLGIGKVIRSEHPDYKPGEYVYGILNWEEYSIPPDLSKGTTAELAQTIIRKLTLQPGLSWPVYLGAAGMPGQTAYHAWKEYSQAKKGETIFVSGGGGPVGLMVIQLAKLDGLKVIASAGTDDKVKEAKEAGADVVFNYKKADTNQVLEKEGPLNLYWDNVGGPTLDAALGATAEHARIIVCGMISEYNNKNGTTLKNLWTIFGRSLHIHGFLVFDLAPKWDGAFYKEIPPKIASGQIKHREDITRGLEKSGEALVEVQKGLNFGKKVVLVADD